MVPIIKRFMIEGSVGPNLAAPLVGLGGVGSNIPAQWVHGGDHEPIHDGAAGIHHEGKRAH